MMSIFRLSEFTDLTCFPRSMLCRVRVLGLSLEMFRGHSASPQTFNFGF